MERVEARNSAEAYLYNARNSMNEEKVKASLNDRTTVEETVKTGLEWLDAHREAGADECKEQQKVWEETIRPILMKLYAASAGKPGPADSSSETPAPQVEEVD